MFLAAVCFVAPAQEPQYQEPEEEDQDLVRETEYAFNPVQAAKELKIGNFYWKKGSFRAAAGRYEEATKWDPDFADAYWKLAEAHEKVAEEELVETKKVVARDAARSAYEKYIELKPDSKQAKKARERLAQLGSS
jgi:tetratricopeptide (TPR) repeat protein